MTTEALPETPNSSLRTRAISGAILAAIALTLIYFGGKGYGLMMTLAAAVGSFEWVRMVTTGQQYPKGIAYISGVAGFFGAAAAGMAGNPAISLWFVFALCFLIYAYNFSQKGPSVKIPVAGVIYVTFACGAMIWLRNVPDGLFHTLTLMLIVWGSDVSAYFTGKTIGGPKLAPSISPKKTWAGFIGSSCGAGLLAASLACPWMVAKLGVVTIGGMGSVGYFVMGFILAMAGQAGDLLISTFKRHYGVKDTGALIPGHGGILDRIDALLFVALFFTPLIVLFG